MPIFHLKIAPTNVVLSYLAGTRMDLIRGLVNHVEQLWNGMSLCVFRVGYRSQHDRQILAIGMPDHVACSSTCERNGVRDSCQFARESLHSVDRWFAMPCVEDNSSEVAIVLNDDGVESIAQIFSDYHILSFGILCHVAEVPR